jgi:hypothetical protein
MPETANAGLSWDVLTIKAPWPYYFAGRIPRMKRPKPSRPAASWRAHFREDERMIKN